MECTSKNRKFVQKSIVIQQKCGLVRSVKIPSGYWFVFNLRIRAEEGRVHHAWHECVSNKL